MLHSLPVNRIAGTAPGRRNKRFLALLLTLTAILALMLPASRVKGNSPSAAQLPPDYNGNGCIDVGANALVLGPDAAWADYLPVPACCADLDGAQRPVDGDGTGGPVADLGCYEYQGQ